MERTDIEKKVQDIIADKLDVEACEVKPEALLKDDLGGDSLDCVEMLMEIEKEFGISITDEEAEQVKTVSDAIALVERHVK